MDDRFIFLLVDRKDIVAYSILCSLYRASEKNSQIKQLLNSKNVLSSLKIFVKQPKTFRDVEKGLEAKLARKESFRLPFLQKMYLLGTPKLCKSFMDRFDAHLHRMFYQKSCCGDGNTTECYDFSNDELSELRCLFCRLVDYLLWSGDGSYLNDFPWEVMKYIYQCKKCIKKIIQVMVVYYDGQLKDDGNIFELLELKGKYADNILSGIRRKEELEVFMRKTDFRYQANEKLLSEILTKFDLEWNSDEEYEYYPPARGDEEEEDEEEEDEEEEDEEDEEEDEEEEESE